MTVSIATFERTALNIMFLCIMTFSMTSLSRMTFNITSLSVITFNRITLSKTTLCITTFQYNDTQLFDTQHYNILHAA